MYCVINVPSNQVVFGPDTSDACMAEYARLNPSFDPKLFTISAVGSDTDVDTDVDVPEDEWSTECPSCKEPEFDIDAEECLACGYTEEDVSDEEPAPSGWDVIDTSTPDTFIYNINDPARPSHDRTGVNDDGDKFRMNDDGDWVKVAKTYTGFPPSRTPSIPKPSNVSVSDWSTGKVANGYGNTVTGNAGEVSDLARDRQIRQQRILAESCGIVHSDPMYARGMRCVGEGNKRHRQERDAWENMPSVEEAIVSISQTIVNEERDQQVVPACDIRMRDDGRVVIPGNGTHLPERRVFSKLLSTMKLSDGSPAFPSAGPFLTSLPPGERADTFNKVMNRVGDQDIMVHTRNNESAPDGRALYAITGPKYAAIGADEVLGRLSDAVDFNGAKGYGTYNPDTTNVQLDALWVPEEITDLSAGDVFKFGARFKTNDAGGGSVRGGGVSFQNDCLNLIFVSEVYAEHFRMVHKGSMSDMRHKVHNGMKNIINGFEPLLADWGMLNERDIRTVDLWGERFTNVPDALEWAVSNGKLCKDIANKVALEALLSGYAAERRDGLTTNTLTDIVNAVTRAAWNATLEECERHVMERDAGLLVPVLARTVANA